MQFFSCRKLQLPGAYSDICHGEGGNFAGPPCIIFIINLSLNFLIWPSKVIAFNTNHKAYQKPGWGAPPPKSPRSGGHVPAPPPRYGTPLSSRQTRESSGRTPESGGGEGQYHLPWTQMWFCSHWRGGGGPIVIFFLVFNYQAYVLKALWCFGSPLSLSIPTNQSTNQSINQYHSWFYYKPPP